MKTFIAALIILSAIVGFVIWNTIDLQKTLGEMLKITEALPMEAKDFKKDGETLALVNTLYSLWDQKMGRIVFTGGYDNCNRADEAVSALFIHYHNGNAEDFTLARLILWDSLNRMKMLEGIYLDSIL